MTAAPQERNRDLAGRLRDLGIAVVADTAAALDGPATTVLTVTRAQVAAMADEVAGGTGITGAAIDAVTPMPDGAPPFSYVLAAWLDSADTERSRTARTWLPEAVDFTAAPSLVLPRAALLLFTADVAERTDAELPRPAEDGWAPADATPSPAAIRVQALAQGTGAPCSLVTDFFTRGLHVLFDALRLSPGFLGDDGILSEIGGFLAGLWNTAVDLAEAVIGGLVRELTAPVLAAIGEAVALIGIVAQVSSYVTGWAIAVDGPPGTIPFELAGTTPTEWRLRVRETSRPFPFEAALEDCARVSGVTLPRLFAVGAPVRWRITLERPDPRSPVPALIVPIDPEVVPVPADREAIWRFHLPAEPSADGELRIGVVQVEATLPREEVSQVLDLAHRLLDQTIEQAVSRVPTQELRQIARDQLRRLLRPVIDELTAAVTARGSSILEVRGVHTQFVSYHEPDEPGASLPAIPFPSASLPPPGATPVDACDLLSDAEVGGPLGRLSDENSFRETEIGGGGSFGVGGWFSKCDWFAYKGGDFQQFALQLHSLGTRAAALETWEGWEPVAFSVGEVEFDGRRAWKMVSPYAIGYIILGTGDMIVSGTGPRRTTERLLRLTLRKLGQ